MKLFAWMVIMLMMSSVVAASAPTNEQATGAKVIKKYYGPFVEGVPPFFYAKYDSVTKEVTLLVTQLGISDPAYDLISPADAAVLWDVGTAQEIIEEESKYDRRMLVLPTPKDEADVNAGPDGQEVTPPIIPVKSGTFVSSDGNFQSKVSGNSVELQYKKTIPILDDKGKETGKTKDVYVTFGKAKVSKLQEQYATQDVSLLLSDPDFMNAAVLFDQKQIQIDDAMRSDGVYYHGGSSELFLQDSAVYKNGDGSTSFIEGDFEFDEKGQLLLDGNVPKYQKDDDYTIATYSKGKLVGIVDKDVDAVDGSVLYASVIFVDVSPQGIPSAPVYRVLTQKDNGQVQQVDYPYVTIPGANVAGVQLYADDKGNRIFYAPDTGKYYDKEGKDLNDASFVESDKKGAFDKAKELMKQDSNVRASQNPTHLEYLGRLLTQDFFAFLGQVFAGYQQWRGLGAYGGLFLKDQIGEWRADVDELFCKAYLGTDCVVEKLCEKTSARSTGDNVVVTSSPASGIKAAAYVQAERSEPAIFKDEKGTHEQYLYKITYYASSPDSENAVQLTFKYGGGSYAWYPEPVKVSKGGAVSAQGTSAIVAYSDKRYTEVCVELQNAIETGTGGRAHNACTEIVSSGVNPSGEDPEVPVNESAVPSDVADADVADGEDAAEPEEAPVSPGAGF